MMLLGEAAERLLDFRFAGGLGHAQDLIGIAHVFSGSDSPRQYKVLRGFF